MVVMEVDLHHCMPSYAQSGTYQNVGQQLQGMYAVGAVLIGQLIGVLLPKCRINCPCVKDVDRYAADQLYMFESLGRSLNHFKQQEVDCCLYSLIKCGSRIGSFVLKLACTLLCNWESNSDSGAWGTVGLAVSALA